MQTLINIDYLIINLLGKPFGNFSDNSAFNLQPFDYGTKIFTNRSELYYNNEKIGVFTSVPRSHIIDSELAQLQFENHLFYTKSLTELKNIISQFCLETSYMFKSINRLDICIDRNDKDNYYRNLYDNVVNGTFLISGRPKNIQSYYETFKGKSILNGFSVGKRTSSKLLRCYNKTLSLQLTEKQYINQFYENNGLKNTNVWRFEYQLNSKFFQDLNEVSKHSNEVIEKMTWGIFDYSALVELLKLANTGFFEIHENTGLSQINKEKKIEIFDFDAIKTNYTTNTTKISRLKKIFIASNTIKKRLAKSLFREYYANNQDLSYVIALNLILEDNDIVNDKPLLYWFKNKFNFYLHEFRTKEKIIKTFDLELFREHQSLFL